MEEKDLKHGETNIDNNSEHHTYDIRCHPADPPIGAITLTNIVDNDNGLGLDWSVKELSTEGTLLGSGTWDHVRKQPVFQVEAITTREDPVFEALLPGKAEHKTLMGLPREADIFRAVSRKCKCLDVVITQGGCSWLHAVVQIDKQSDDDARDAIESAFIAHPSLKMCILVDKDVNPADWMEVEWALATRFQADRDAVIMSGKPSSSLDPSAQFPAGKKAIGSKLGLDATIKGGRPEKFTRVPFPTIDPNKLDKLLNG